MRKRHQRIHLRTFGVYNYNDFTEIYDNNNFFSYYSVLVYWLSFSVAGPISLKFYLYLKNVK